MAIETIIAEMDEKRLNLFKYLVLVGFAITLGYAVLNIATLNWDIMSFAKSPALLVCVMSGVALSIVWKILNGAKVVIPDQSNAFQQTPNRIHQQPVKTTYSGSWECPKCRSYVIGNQCEKCGFKRR